MGVDQMRQHRRVLVSGEIDRHFASYDAAGLTAHNLVVNCIKVHTPDLKLGLTSEVNPFNR